MRRSVISVMIPTKKSCLLAVSPLRRDTIISPQNPVLSFLMNRHSKEAKSLFPATFFNESWHFSVSFGEIKLNIFLPSSSFATGKPRNFPVCRFAIRIVPCVSKITTPLGSVSMMVR